MAYYKMIKYEPKRVLNVEKPSYKRIIDVLKTGPRTAQEIAGILGIEINRVSGRLTELHEADYIYVKDMVKLPTRKTNRLWALTGRE